MKDIFYFLFYINKINVFIFTLNLFLLIIYYLLFIIYYYFVFKVSINNENQ